MALKNLFGWSRKTEAKASSACGSACGAGDKPAEPSSACGAADPKPTACGSACGARAPAGQPAGAHFPRDGVCTVFWEMRPLLKEQTIRR